MVGVNAIASTGPDASVAVQPEAVEQAVAALGKDAAVGQAPPAIDLETADVARSVGQVAGAGVGNVEHRFVRRKRQPVGLDEVVDHQFDRAAGRVDAVHVAGADLAVGALAFVVRQDAVARIGEPDAAIGMHHHIVRRVQPLAFPVAGQHGDGAIVLGARHAPGQVLTGHQTAFPVDRVAIGVLGRLAKHRRKAIALVESHHAVVRDVGPDQCAVRAEPRRAFAPSATGPQTLDPFGLQQATPETSVQYFKAGAVEGSERDHELLF